METSEAKMLVRSLNNSTARILMAFVFARTALDVKQLRDWTGMKRETIYNALEELKSIHKVQDQAVAHGRRVWLPAGDLLPGFRQMSETGTPEIQMSPKRTPELPDVPKKEDETLLVGGGLKDSELINLTPPPTQVSAERTSELPDVLEILRHTDLLFDGDLVMSRDLADREPLYALAWCAYAYSRKSKLDGPGGLVRKRLMDNEAPPEWAKQQWRDVLPNDFLEALGLVLYVCQECAATFHKLADLDAHSTTHPRRFVCPYCEQVFGEEIDLDAHVDQEHTPKSMPIDASVQELISGNMNAERAWQAVLGQLQMEMPRAAFDSWVRDTRAVRYDRNDRILYIGARNAYTRDWLESRLASTVSRLLVGILNTNVCVAFVVSDSAVEEVEP